MPSSAFVVDRTTCMSRSILIETIRCYLEQDAVVQIIDSTMPPGDRFLYGVQIVDGIARAFDPIGRCLGVFADVAALVTHAETVTGVWLDAGP